MDNSKSDSEEDQEKKNKSLLYFLYRKFKRRSENAEPPPVSDSPPVEHLPEEEKTAADAVAPEMPFSLPALQRMYAKWAAEQQLDERPAKWSSYLEAGLHVKRPEDAPAVFLTELEEAADAILQALQETLQNTQELGLDGRVKCKVSEDGLCAWGMVFPPLKGGKPVEAQDVQEALQALGVQYGIRQEILQEMVLPENALRLYTVAVGEPARDGVDGRIEEVIPHTVGTPYMEDKNGVVDYADLNWLVHVEEKQVICRIYPPQPGKSGMTVGGVPLPCKEGKKAVVPMGKNTMLSEDGTALIAKTAGQIFYTKNQYRVTDVIRIDSDVDLSTGNICVKGNVFVQGNVLDGFRVEATGDVNIAGSVAAGTVIAGGNVFVKNGINGGGRGLLQAGVDIKCRYIESAQVQAQGNIYADSIINSTVYCDGSVLVESGRGAIVGGNVTAMTAIHAKEAGNERGVLTRLNIERTPSFIAWKDKTTKEYRAAKQKRMTTEEQLRLLENAQKRADHPDPKVQKAVQELHLNLSVFLVKEHKLEEQLTAVHEKEDLLHTAQVRLQELYPPVHVRMNTISRIWNERRSKCLIFESDTDLEMGRL